MSPPPSKPSNRTKTQLKARYESSGHVAGLTLSVAASDVKLKTSFTDATFINGPSLEGLSLGVEKPGHFMFDYDVAHQVLTLCTFPFPSPLLPLSMFAISHCLSQGLVCQRVVPLCVSLHLVLVGLERRHIVSPPNAEV